MNKSLTLEKFLCVSRHPRLECHHVMPGILQILIKLWNSNSTYNSVKLPNNSLRLLAYTYMTKEITCLCMCICIAVYERVDVTIDCDYHSNISLLKEMFYLRGLKIR